MIDRNLLTNGFRWNDFPKFQCPHCLDGTLKLPKKFKRKATARSEAEKDAHWFEPEHYDLRLVSELQCSNKSMCGDYAMIFATGRVFQEPYFDEHTEVMETQYEEFYDIKCIYPSPRLIKIPVGTPPGIESFLEAAFDSFWAHPALSLNSIRSALEAILSHFGIEKEKNGKFQTLFSRIDALKSLHPEISGFLNVLRPHLNEASHGAEIPTETLLDIFEALEIFLFKEFGDQEAKFAMLTDKISNSSSRIKPECL